MKNRVLVFIASVLLMSSLTVLATETKSYEEKLRENEALLEEKESEKEQISSAIGQLNDEISSIVRNLAQLSSEIDAIQSQIRVKSQEIAEKEIQVEALSLRIAELEEDIRIQLLEIEAKEEELEVQKDMLSERVRAAYKYNSFSNIIFTLIESQSILDFTERLLFIEKMAKQDNEMIETINGLIEELMERKQFLEETRIEFVEAKTQLETERAALVDAKDMLEREHRNLADKMGSVQRLESEKRAAYERMSNEEKRVAEQIGDIMSENAELERTIQVLIREAQRRAEEERRQQEEEARRQEEERKKQEEERRRQEEEAGEISEPDPPAPQPPATAPSSGYIRPVSGRITSGYGYRIHPIWGDRRFHTGVDFAGPTGDPIKAVRDGVVILRQYYYGYGNTVIIDHGNGVSSLYAHMHNFNVSLGTRVSQGQVIGTVGSTGDSTGPHLHFEIRINGNHVNPMNYLN